MLKPALICGLLALGAFGQPPFPPNAKVIERAKIRSDREIVLWMESPVKHAKIGGLYTCPEVTRGAFYSGPTRVSLLDTSAGEIINTIAVRDEDDSFDIPYWIVPDYYYSVPGVLKGVEGKPKFLSLRDFNGDGQRLEFSFYDAQACMGLETALFGYSPKQDRLIQYAVELTIEDHMINFSAKTDRVVRKVMDEQKWIQYFFNEQPAKLTRPAYWNYTVDFSGRGGWREEYRIRYDASRETFIGSLVRSRCP